MKGKRKSERRKEEKGRSGKDRGREGRKNDAWIQREAAKPSP